MDEKRRRIPLLSAIVALVVVGVLPVLAAARPAEAAPDDQCAPRGLISRSQPWGQQLLDPESVWPFSEGRGVTVAVLASGVDAGHPQLHGHVLSGANFLTGGGKTPGNTDCSGIGTQVAGVIAAQPAESVGFNGLAPGAKILPVVVSEGTQVTSDDTGRSVDIKTFADAIAWAADHGADVIDLPAVSYQDNPVLEAAVEAAIGKNVVVVAATGAAQQDQPGRIPYPAGYDGVIGVGAIDQDGQRVGTSPVGPYVDLMAPGAALFSTQRGGGLAPVEGTGIASGYVAAAAALVRSRWPDMSPAEVSRRLVATATPAPGAPGNDEYGYGIANPYAAITEGMAYGPPMPMPSFTSPGRNAAADARQAEWSGKGRLAAWIAAGGLAVVIAVLVVAAALPRGRRRRWRSTFAKPPPYDADRDLPAPPVQLFDDA